MGAGAIHEHGGHAVPSHGIVFGHVSAKDEVIAWTAFEHAAYNWLTGRTVLNDTVGRRILSRGRRFFLAVRVWRGNA